MRSHVDSWYSSSSFDSTQDDSISEYSDYSFDEDDTLNTRITPCWANYRCVIEAYGYRLDTYRDVREFYERYWERIRSKGECDYDYIRDGQGYLRACNGFDDDLCKDAGLPENLFRGTNICDGKKVVIKAVRLRSREYEITRILSSPPLRDNPMNQTIPVLELIEIPEDDIAFIVQEEWSSQRVSGAPCSLFSMLNGIRECLLGLVFMHSHNIAHLDISLSNILTDDLGHYKYIDFEQSRYYPDAQCPRIRGYRGTEIPPEVERGEDADPYKIDVWALGVLILRAYQLLDLDVPELMALILPTLRDTSEARPTAKEVLQAFDTLLPRINEAYLEMSSD